MAAPFEDAIAILQQRSSAGSVRQKNMWLLFPAFEMRILR